MMKMMVYVAAIKVHLAYRIIGQNIASRSKLITPIFQKFLLEGHSPRPTGDITYKQCMCDLRSRIVQLEGGVSSWKANYSCQNLNYKVVVGLGFNLCIQLI